MTIARESRDLPAAREGALARVALGFTSWAERWFPDAYIFAALAVILVSVAALVNGAAPQAVAKSFGDGFWTLIPFTMQMAFVVISGYVVAMSPPAARLIRALASIPGSGPRAVAFVAAISMLSSLLNWGMSLIFSGLLVRELARRSDLGMDYRAAGAAAYLGLGATWALGLSSSAAQLQANPGEPAQVPDADHRHHPLLRYDLSLAVHDAVRDPDRCLNNDLLVVRPDKSPRGDGERAWRRYSNCRPHASSTPAAQRMAGI